MAAAALAARETVPAAPPLHYRFSVSQYLKMIDAGVLDQFSRVELLNGWVLQKMSRNPSHDVMVEFLTQYLVRLLPVTWLVRVQLALLLARSVPEPDLALVRGPRSRYRRRHPRLADTGLIIEVAESSLTLDRDQKGPLYAAGRLPEYWIVNLVERQLEVYTRPQGGRNPGFRSRQDYRPGTQVRLTLDGQDYAMLDVAELFSQV